MELAFERSRTIGVAGIIRALAGLARRLVGSAEHLPDPRHLPDRLRRDIGLN